MRLVSPAMRRKRAKLRQQTPIKQVRFRGKTARREKPRRYAPLYGSKRWRQLRQAKLSEHTICQCCGQRAATDVDHIEKHDGDWDRFHDFANLQSLCELCHRAKGRFERNLAVRFHDPHEGKPVLRFPVDMNGKPEV